jgi:hyperosmotically inducible periplasmic protein
MEHFRLSRAAVLALALTLPLWAEPLGPQAADKKTQPDNTAVNKRDRNPGALTADQQKMNSADRKLTAKVRRLIMTDKELSTYARNVKIISRDGVVTLKGPVKSDQEAKSIMAKAISVTGHADKVVNEMSVQPASKP